MFTRSTLSMRALPFALASILTAAGAAHAGQATLRFDPPKRAGSVRVFFTDLNGTTLNVNVPIAAGMNAAQKRTAIQNAIVAAGLPAGWTVAGAANSLTIRNANNLSMVANFFPRNTGELMDQAIIEGNTPSTFPGGHGKMDPHAPMGMSLSNGAGGPAAFNAGVIVGGVPYVYSISGSDPAFGGASSVDELTLTNLLYNGLASLPLPSGVSLTNAGAAGIDVVFDPSIWSLGDYGLLWGTDSITGGTDDSGFNGSITALPTPGAIALSICGALAAARRRRAN
jgi:hypothetical protein